MIKHKLFSASQARELDRVAIDEFAIDSYTLMCRAGRALHLCIMLRWPAITRVVICCGAGNNGGDGYVLARLLKLANVYVRVFSTVEPASLANDAKRAYLEFCALGDDARVIEETEFIGETDLIVDAILGSGIDRDIRPELAKIIEQINCSNAPVLSIDVPSGLSASTGKVMGAAVKANVTLTVIANKCGLHTLDGPDHTGELFLNTLDVPDEAYLLVPSLVSEMVGTEIKTKLPVRYKNSHKGSFGTLIFIGGNAGMQGAISLAANASLRSGAGLVKATVQNNYSGDCLLPDIIRINCPDGLIEARDLESSSALGIGPGLGTDEWAQRLFLQTSNCKCPMVLDADALNLLAEQPRSLSRNCVLTPHPKEAARLLNTSVEEVLRDRFETVLALANKFESIVVLKGCGTLVSDGRKTFVCTRGNPAMAVAGMGDVLTGIIAGLLAQGLDAMQAAIVGVYWHAFTCDQAYADFGYGLVASDVTNYMSEFTKPHA